MARKLHRGALQSTAAALVLAALAVACQSQGGGGATTRGTHPAASAAAAAKNQPASPVPPGPGPFASDATDRNLASSLAAAVQRAFTPPPGSRELSGPPAGTWHDLEVPGGVIPTDGEVFVSSWWKVPGQPQAVLKWLLAHEPKPWYGGGRGGFGPVAEPGDVTPAGQRPADVYQGWNDTFEDFHGPAVITLQQLIVEELQNGAGQTYTRVDSVVTWSPPPPTPDRIELTFSAAPGGPPLATADADFRGCGQVSFSVPGTSSLPLLAEVNDRLVPTILSAAGLSWFS